MAETKKIVAPKKLIFNKDKLCVAARTSGRTIGFMATGTLTLGDKTYNVISGPWKQGVLPNGIYAVRKYNVVIHSKEAGYLSPTNKGWFIPLTAPANVKRNGFGVHPDGNVKGTAGCIGLVDLDADKFMVAWLKIPIAERPDTLEVTGVTEAGKEICSISGEGKNE